jgi:hypothetical protein
VGFGRVCAPVRCAHPSLGFLNTSIAASLLFLRISKIKIIYLTRAARVKGFFLSTLPPRPESIQSARPSIQSCELGPPTPSTARECCSPPFGSKGGGTFTSGWGCGGNQLRRWGIHSGTLSILQYNYNPSTAEAMKYNVPWPPPLTSELRWSFWRTIKRKKPQNHSMGEYPAISIICRENPAKCPSLAKNPPK